MYVSKKQHCHITRAIHESLESRRLLTAIPAGIIPATTYTSDTEWLDTSQPYTLVGTVRMNNGGRFKFGPGVRVQSPGGHSVIIGEDNTITMIEANGARFDSPLVVKNNSIGTITGNTFYGSPTFDREWTSLLELTGNTLNAGVTIHPEFAPKLPGNTFVANTVVNVLGARVVDNSTTWSVVGGIVRYNLVHGGDGITANNDVYVQGSSTILTINPNLIVSSDNVNAYDIQLSNSNGIGGRLVANNITLTSRVIGWNQGSASITNSQIQAITQFGAPSVAGTTITGNTITASAVFDVGAESIAEFTLSSNTFNGGVTIHPEFAPKLNGNTFVANTVVNVLGARIVDNDTSWSVVSGIVRYNLVHGGDGITANNDVYVQGSSTTLTVSSNLIVSSDSVSSYDIQLSNSNGIGGRLTANNVTFTSRIIGWNQGTAAISNSQIQAVTQFSAPSLADSTITGNTFSASVTFDVSAETSADFHLANNTFNAGVTIHPEFAPKLNGNTFAANTVVNVLGARVVDNSTTWPVVSGIVRYNLVHGGDGITANNDVYVQGSSTILTINPNLIVSSDNVNAYDIQLSNSNGIGGGLYQNYGTVNARIIVGNAASIYGRYVDYNQYLQINSGATVDIHLSDFATSTASVESTGNAANSINLINNYWGTTNSQVIEDQKLIDNTDSPVNQRPEIIFNPFLTASPLDLTAPVVGFSFEFETQQRLRVVFSEDVSASLQASDLIIKRRSDGLQIPLATLTWDSVYTTSATGTFLSLLPDGDYDVYVVTNAITDPAGNPVAAGQIGNFGFFVLAGDANRDRTVNFNDLLIVAQNYGHSSRTFSQGNFDYSANGLVDFSDLLIVAQSYENQLPAARVGYMANLERIVVDVLGS